MPEMRSRLATGFAPYLATVAISRKQAVCTLSASRSWKSQCGGSCLKKSESLPSPKIPDLADLPPGFRRPTRLSFSFLPGDSDRSPICGWFVLNSLDDNILVFAASGSSLGSIDTDGRRRPPASSPSPEPPMIDNAVLRGLVSDILKRGKSYGERFRSICAAALEAIEAPLHNRPRSPC